MDDETEVRFTPPPCPTETEPLSAFLVARGYAPIPLARNVVGHFEVEARVNGQPLRLLLDTGASRTVLDVNAAVQLGLNLEASEQQAGGVGTATQAVQLATAASFDLGSLSLGSRPLAIIDLSHVSQALSGHGGNAIDGAIGGDILRDHDGIIEYTAATLYLRPFASASGGPSND